MIGAGLSAERLLPGPGSETTQGTLAGGWFPEFQKSPFAPPSGMIIHFIIRDDHWQEAQELD
jgi:hypothetical protein